MIEVLYCFNMTGSDFQYKGTTFVNIDIQKFFSATNAALWKAMQFSDGDVL